MDENRICTLIVDSAVQLHQPLDPTVVESVYEVTLEDGIARIIRGFHEKNRTRASTVRRDAARDADVRIRRT